jgi:AcrR family transcriptional regulator
MPRAAQPTKPGSKQKVVAEFRRAEILAAAAKVFSTKGYDATRMEEIAKAAQLAKGTLYLYFKSKDAVYEATVEQALAQLAVITEEHVGHESTFAGKLAAFISVRNSFWRDQQQLYRIILTINRQEQHRKRSIGWQKQAVLYLKKMFEDAAKSGELPQQDFLAAAWTTMDAMRGINERRAFSGGRSPAEDAKFLTEFLLGALNPKPQK